MSTVRSGSSPYVMREPCRWCKAEGIEVQVGTVQAVNGQDVVRCKRCERQCYNAPRTETGKPQRKVRTRPELSFGQRERILQRDGGRCFLCGRDPLRHGVILHVAHVLSVADGRAQGVDDELLFGDANLVTACEECNAGMGKVSLEPRIWLALCRAQMGRRP
jgi:5-methylcytosine-specific restriction endonuclease McrA